MNKSLSKIKYFRVDELRRVAADHITKFKHRVVSDGIDKNGRHLPVYSDGYREALERDMRIKRGKR